MPVNEPSPVEKLLRELASKTSSILEEYLSAAKEAVKPPEKPADGPKESIWARAVKEAERLAQDTDRGTSQSPTEEAKQAAEKARKVDQDRWETAREFTKPPVDPRGQKKVDPKDVLKEHPRANDLAVMRANWDLTKGDWSRATTDAEVFNERQAAAVLEKARKFLAFADLDLTFWEVYSALPRAVRIRFRDFMVNDLVENSGSEKGARLLSRGAAKIYPEMDEADELFLFG